MLIKYFIAFTSTLLPLLLAANERDKPLTIDADSAVVDQINNTTIYSGNVILTQGDLLLKSDTLTVSIADKEVSKVVAQGTPVTIKRSDKQGCDVTGQSKRIEYTPADETILLLGSAKLNQQQTELNGEHIVYKLSEALLKSEGRTRTVFPLAENGKPIGCKPNPVS